MQRGMMMQFDKLPLPVYVLRVEADASGLPQDFIFVSTVKIIFWECLLVIFGAITAPNG